MAVLPRVRRFSVDEFERMVRAGVFASDDRLELIEGEIVEMTPIGPPHGAVVDRLNALMSRHLMDRVVVRVQGPVGFVPLHSRPQPDLALLRPRADYYAKRLPGAGDIVLLVEVMDTSGEYDRRRKAPLYARAGVQELWLVDIPAGVVAVLREPSADGYRGSRTHRRGESLSVLAFPDVTLPVDDVLG